MAIFETGTASSIPNLLNNLVAFCVANGWTANFNALEGDGRRAHLQKGSVYINFRAVVNELSQAGLGGYGAAYGLAVNGSTGYNGASAWHNQPGAPFDGNLTYRMAGMMNMAGAITAYYFHARADMIYVWIEQAAGFYQFMGFGGITKHGGWSGGSIFFANSEGHQNDNSNIGATLIGNVETGAGNFTTNQNGFLYGTFDGITGWAGAGNNFQQSPAMPKFFSTLCIQTIIGTNAANQFNGLSVLLPIDIAVTRDGAGNINTASNFSIEGYLPDIYFCNIRSLVPAQQLDDGSGEIFRIYPFRSKLNTGQQNGWYGVAIKEN